jgi:hypothetical protein
MFISVLRWLALRFGKPSKMPFGNITTYELGLGKLDLTMADDDKCYYIVISDRALLANFKMSYFKMKGKP